MPVDAGLHFLLPNLYCLRQIAGVLAEYVWQFWYCKVYMHSFLKLLSWLLGYMGFWWVCWCMKTIIRCFFRSFRLTQSCFHLIILFTVVEFYCRIWEVTAKLLVDVWVLAQVSVIRITKLDLPSLHILLSECIAFLTTAKLQVIFDTC